MRLPLPAGSCRWPQPQTPRHTQCFIIRCANNTTRLDSADMEPQWRPLHEPSACKVWQQVLRPVAAEMQTCAPLLAQSIVDRYQSELPKIVPDVSLPHWNCCGAHHWRSTAL